MGHDTFLNVYSVPSLRRFNEAKDYTAKLLLLIDDMVSDSFITIESVLKIVQERLHIQGTL